MKTFEFNKVEIEKFFIKAERILMNQNSIHLIKYTDFDHTTFDLNNQELLRSVADNPIVYCIWTKNPLGFYAPKYIGHTHKITRQRIRAHLTKKNEKTGAKLAKVIEELEAKNSIGISVLVIEPAYMRKSLEDWLIHKHSDKLIWNTVGRK